MQKTYKPGVGRKPLKPDYDAATILQEQMQAAVVVLIDKHRQQSPRFLPPIVKNGVNLSVNPVCFLRSVNFYFTDESEPSLVIISEAENRLLFSHLYLSILHRKCNR